MRDHLTSRTNVVNTKPPQTWSEWEAWINRKPKPGLHGEIGARAVWEPEVDSDGNPRPGMGVIPDPDATMRVLINELHQRGQRERGEDRASSVSPLVRLSPEEKKEMDQWMRDHVGPDSAKEPKSSEGVASRDSTPSPDDKPRQ